jgi:DNA polymerase-3 subunit alpha
MLEDDTAKVEAVVFPEAFAKCGALAVADALVLVKGKFERDEESSRLLVADIVPLDVVREKAVKAVEIRLSGKGLARTTMRELAGVLDRYPGDRRVSVIVEVAGTPSPLRVRAATARRIKPSDLFVKDVEAVCGAGAVVLK